MYLCLIEYLGLQIAALRLFIIPANVVAEALKAGKTAICRVFLLKEDLARVYYPNFRLLLVM